jgi:hypothetical protein
VITKAGLRLSSVVCDTEVIVVKAPQDEVDLRCGGQPMVELSDATVRQGAPTAPHNAGVLIGKRYTTPDAALELLCTKPGQGSLSIGDVALEVKQAAPLPASD